jgi:FKBP-type peptidyl-prolyl cis-trans isomerase
MKSPLIHGLVTLLFFLGLDAGRAAGATNSVPPASNPAFTEPQIVETWGWMIAQDKGVAGIEISQAELPIFLRGFAANLNHRPAPADLREIFPNLQQLARARREKMVQATIRNNEAEAKAFFTRLRKNTNVVELPNGLCYEILKPGTGYCPKSAQTVNVHYFGHLLNGTEFAEFGPLDMILVTNHTVCRGWVDALQRFNAGTRAKLYVPPPLSEREAEGLGVEPGSALVFTIEVFAVKDTPVQDLADATVPMPPDSEPPYVEGVTDRQLIEAWGWSVAQQTRAAQFGLGASEIAALTKGLTAGIKAQPAPCDLRKIYPEVERFVNDRRERVRAAVRQQRLAEMNTLFAGLKQNTNVVELPSGLRYEILRPGKGPYPKPGQMVIADYTGRLVDGTEFDRTDNEPLHIEIGLAIRGLNEGLQKINRGGRIRLYLPPDLGFGDVAASGGVTGIPANSTLIYDVELLDIEAPSPAAAGPEKK